MRGRRAAAANGLGMHGEAKQEGSRETHGARMAGEIRLPWEHCQAPYCQCGPMEQNQANSYSCCMASANRGRSGAGIVAEAQQAKARRAAGSLHCNMYGHRQAEVQRAVCSVQCARRMITAGSRGRTGMPNMGERACST